MLKTLKESFIQYLNYGARSTHKLIPLHSRIANDIQSQLGSEYTVKSLGINDGREYEVKGYYYDKKADITILKNGIVKSAVFVKFVMSNYSQNSKNYFPNTLGDTINIRKQGVDYYDMFIIFNRMPYFTNAGEIKRIEILGEKQLNKYKTLSNESLTSNEVANSTLFVCIDTDIDYSSITNKIEYANCGRTAIFSYTNPFDEELGSSVILNDYEKYVKLIVSNVLKKEDNGE